MSSSDLDSKLAAMLADPKTAKAFMSILQQQVPKEHTQSAKVRDERRHGDRRKIQPRPTRGNTVSGEFVRNILKPDFIQINSVKCTLCGSITEARYQMVWWNDAYVVGWQLGNGEATPSELRVESSRYRTECCQHCRSYLETLPVETLVGMILVSRSMQTPTREDKKEKHEPPPDDFTRFLLAGAEKRERRAAVDLEREESEPEGEQVDTPDSFYDPTDIESDEEFAEEMEEGS